MAEVLAIIVTYNGMRWIDRCLGSVRASGIDAVVIDNGSTDGTAEYIAEHFPEMQLVQPGSNLGFGAANNIGLRKALDGKYDFAYLLNQDAWLNEDTLEKLLAAAAPEYAILSPIQTDAEGKPDKRFARKCGKALASTAESIADVRFVMAAHWLVSRKAIETVGGFSPAFKQYGEDDNWIHRARYFGFRIGIVPVAKAVHDRAERKLSKEAQMNLKCTATVVKLSNPCNCPAFRYIVEPCELLCMAVKNASLYPLKFIPALLGRYGELTRLRAESKRRGAFLRVNS